MANKAIDQLLTRSIDNYMTNNGKELTMTFVRDIIFEKKFGDALSFMDGSVKEEFTDA